MRSKERESTSHTPSPNADALQAAGMVHRALSLRGATAPLLHMSNPGTARARYIAFETCVQARTCGYGAETPSSRSICVSCHTETLATAPLLQSKLKLLVAPLSLMSRLLRSDCR